MKQLLMIAALAIVSLSAKAQIFHNDSQCDLEYREVCIDVTGAPSGCSITGSGSWVSVPAMTHVPLSPSGCMPPDEVGYEIRYDFATTGCTGSVIIKAPVPTGCTNYPDNDFLPPCANCSPNPNGPHVHVNPTNVHVDP